MRNALIFSLVFTSFFAKTQSLEPGFNRDEYRELMLISVQTTTNDEYASQFVRPQNYSVLYQSQPMALDNLWELWVNNRGNSAVISLRGTTEKTESWLLNFYAAMVPAIGQLKWGEDHTFDYHLADDPRAAVHAGWLIGMAFLAEDILPKLDYIYNEGIRNFYIVGHSQGGGIGYLLMSHLTYLQEQGKLPPDIQFKTYCSAAPKPGNLYFAYSFESHFQNGWAFNIVNAADWVPEVPISIQTLDDFNETNPFIHADDIIAKQKLTERIALKHVYKKLDKPTRKAQQNYQKYLGDEAHKMVSEKIEGLEVPDYLATSNYVRTGIQIVLQPDDAYYKEFPYDSTDVFTHHNHRPYLYLAEKLETPFYEEETPTLNSLGQEWLLSWFDNKAQENWEYENYQPTLKLESETGTITGYTGCNRFNGSAEFDGSNISIAKEMIMTKRACPGINEQAFIDTLLKASSYYLSSDGRELLLMNEDKVLMKFKSKS